MLCTRHVGVVVGCDVSEEDDSITGFVTEHKMHKGGERQQIASMEKLAGDMAAMALRKGDPSTLFVFMGVWCPIPTNLQQFTIYLWTLRCNDLSS